MAIHNLIEFAARYDPVLPERLRGAAAFRMDELEQLAALRLPPGYRDFLALMGAGPEWLQPAGVDLRLEPLLAYYRREPWRPPAGYLKIGLGTRDPFFDIYLEARRVPEPRVVSMPRGPTADFATYQRSFRRPLGGSLEEYLSTWAYRSAGLRRYPQAVRLAGQDTAAGVLAAVAPLLAGFGLEPAAFSSDWVQVFVGDAHGAIATQFPGSVLAIELAAREAPLLRDMQDALRAAIALPHVFAARPARP